MQARVFTNVFFIFCSFHERGTPREVLLENRPDLQFLNPKKPDSDMVSFTNYKGIPVPGGTAEASFHKISETYRSVRLEVEKK